LCFILKCLKLEQPILFSARSSGKAKIVVIKVSKDLALTLVVVLRHML
jgi:hypothetical protein